MRLLTLLQYCKYHFTSHYKCYSQHIAVVDVFTYVYCCVPRMAHVPIVAFQGGEGVVADRQNTHNGSTSTTARISLQFNPQPQSTSPPRLNMFIVVLVSAIPSHVVGNDCVDSNFDNNLTIYQMHLRRNTCKNCVSLSACGIFHRPFFRCGKFL